MKKRTTLPRLTIKYILNKISSEEIFSYYWSISLQDISYCINTGKAMFAPYRKDVNKPSLGFYIKNEKLYARDFGGYFWGDCFDAVAFTLKLGKSGSEFGKLLDTIARDFGIHKYKTKSNSSYKTKIKTKQVQKSKIEISVSARNWNYNDANYWKKRYNIGSKLLNEYYVYPVDTAFINGLLCYTYDSYNPCYAYFFGLDDDGIQNWKLYYPFANSKKGQSKFMQNSSCIEGALHIKKAKYGIITKSYKDVIALENVIRETSLPILALATPSESTLLSDNQYKTIMEYVDVLYTLSDYDRTGLKFASKMRKKYNTIPLLFTRGLFKKYDFKAKDFSDNIEKHGFNNLCKLTNNIYKHGHKDFLTKFTNEQIFR